MGRDLHQRVVGPAVDGQVRIAVGREVAAEVDGPTVLRQWKIDYKSRRLSTHLPLPGFQPLPPTKLPVLLQETEYWLPEPMA